MKNKKSQTPNFKFQTSNLHAKRPADNSFFPMLQVLHLVASSRGGAAEVVRCLVKGLDRSRFTCVVGMPDDGGQIAAEDFAALKIPLERFALQSGFDLNEWRRLRRFIFKGNFDIVHVHGARAALWGRLAAVQKNRPRIIFSVHGLSIVHFTGLKRAGLILLERVLQTVTDATLCVSSAEQAEMRQRKLGAAGKTHLVWNGIDLERLSGSHDRLAIRAELGVAARAPTLITVCRLDKPRDFETLTRGMAQIIRVYPDAQLLIVGDGPMRDQIESRIAQLQINHAVKLLGMRRDVARMFAAADVAVLITQGWEGLPLSILEALAMRLPVIVSDVGGNRDAVVDGESGLVIPPRDVESFVNAALKLLSHPTLAQQMGEAGAARVRQCFALQTMIDQVSAIYLSSLENPSRL